MIKIYIRNISTYCNEKYINSQINHVTKNRRDRIQSFLRIEDKTRCLVAGLLLRHICGVTNDNQLSYGKYGKPYLKNNKIFFSLSHSGEYVVLGISDCEIGIDIEKICPYDNSISNRFFTKEENDWLKKQGNDKAFYKLWTAKESVMKLTGEGLNLSPESFSVLPVKKCIHYLLDKSFHIDWFEYDNHNICYSVLN